MSWSCWIECKFDDTGKLVTSPLSKVPARSGVYAIATQVGSSYKTHYVGRSKNSMRERLKSHLAGKGNKVIAGILKNKQQNPIDPTQALHVAYLETKDEKLIEAVYLDGKDRPLANLIRARLPRGLREQDVLGSSLDN